MKNTVWHIAFSGSQSPTYSIMILVTLLKGNSNKLLGNSARTGQTHERFLAQANNINTDDAR